MKTLESLSIVELTSMSSADVRANLRALIDYSDALLTRSAVIYTKILTTAESASENPVAFLITAFSDVWPKSLVADKDGNFPLLGFSTVELKVREGKLALTEEQKDAYRKVNAFKVWVQRQKKDPSAAPAAKTLPKAVVNAIAKLQHLVDNAVEVEVEKADGTIETEKVINVSDLVAVISIISAIE